MDRKAHCGYARRMYDPPSPCIGVCRLDPATLVCEGCKRTLEEIADWPMLGAADKRAVIERVRSR